jgi:hypothetical protein
VIRACAPRANDFKRQLCRYEDQINEVQRAGADGRFFRVYDLPKELFSGKALARA